MKILIFLGLVQLFDSNAYNYTFISLFMVFYVYINIIDSINSIIDSKNLYSGNDNI